MSSSQPATRNLQPATRTSQPVILWLLSGCLLIFLMVVVGGITRLTGSGLSITEWKPIMGAVPPMSDEEWNIAFEKYKQIPQYQIVNSHFTISDFKQIFFWEYLHRLIARFIGVVFLIPFAWFVIKKKLSPAMMKRSLFLFGLGGLQGFIGWYMVSSGLQDLTSVSHIRLAVHLITAFITFGFTLYFALELIDPRPAGESEGRKHLNFVRLLFGLIIIQIMYGAFVAGLHAGKIHTTFPLMSGQVIPSDILSYPSFLKNVFDNPVTVQFIHRFFAFAIVFLTGWLWLSSRKSILTGGQTKSINYLLIALSIQFILGVVTLLTAVNIPIALLHQAGAFFLFSAGVFSLFQFTRKTSQQRV